MFPKRIVSVFFFLSLACMIGCSSDNKQIIDELHPEFRVSSSILAVSRAPQLDQSGAGKFVSGDQNTLFFHTSRQEFVLAHLYIYGQKYFWNDFPLPPKMEDLFISACYPPVVTDTPENYRWDIREKADFNDLLIAAPISVKQGTRESISLAFTHAFHRLVVELKPENSSITEDMLKEATIVCCNVHPVAILNLLEGTVIGADDDMAEFSVSGAKAVFILPPQQIADMKIKVTVAGRSITYNLSDCRIEGKQVNSLLGGYSLDMKINVSQSSFTIVGQEINGWGIQGEIEHSMIV